MYSLILLSGGIGSRMGESVPKQYMLLAGKPMIMHTIERIDEIDEIDEIVIVCVDEYVESINLMLKQYGILKKVIFATAGSSRQESVYSGLKTANFEDVVIHEAARPFVKKELFKELISSNNNNVTLGYPISFTVLRGHNNIEGILDRDELFDVQLPQKFEKSILLSAHESAIKDGKLFTEDASMVYYYNPDIIIDIQKGTDYNVKITNPTDMLVGEEIYKQYFLRRV